MLGKKIKFKEAKTPLKKIIKGRCIDLEPISINKHSKDLNLNFLKDDKNKI